jgi:hypothetical protein
MNEDHWTLACLCGAFCRVNVGDFKHLPLHTRRNICGWDRADLPHEPVQPSRAQEGGDSETGEEIRAAEKTNWPCTDSKTRTGVPGRSIFNFGFGNPRFNPST